MTPEAKVKKQVTKILNELGAYYFFPATHGYGRAGIPDIIVCFDGRFIAIECKAENGKLTKLQQNELDKIYEHGGGAFVISPAELPMLKTKLLMLKGA